MMSGNILCILLLYALPNVLAITCYKCTPNPPIIKCVSGDINITNCDMDLPKGMADACTKVSIVMAMGPTKIAINQMGCGMKAMCGNLQDMACNRSKLQQTGLTLEKCEATCCEQDSCNGIGGAANSASGSVATSTVSLRNLPANTVPVNIAPESTVTVSGANVSASTVPNTGAPPGPTSDGCVHNAASIVAIFASVTVLYIGSFIG